MDDSQSKCQDFWCDPEDTYCAQYSAYTCDEIGLGSLSETFTEPEAPDWSSGSLPTGSGAGGGTTPSSQSTGACAYFQGMLNRILCEQRSTGSCSGKFFGTGTTCHGLSCPLGSTSPSSCTLPGGSTSSGGGGACTSSYQGPMGDVQVYTQCASVWNYRCQQKNNDAADKNCLVYKSLEATVACPYCR